MPREDAIDPPFGVGDAIGGMPAALGLWAGVVFAELSAVFTVKLGILLVAMIFSLF